MSSDFFLILAVAGAAAVASPLGGLVALWAKPTTLFMSLALGFASGVLLGTVSFEMMPQALELSSVPVAVAGFLVGFAAVCAFDLFIHRGKLAGPRAALAGWLLLRGLSQRRSWASCSRSAAAGCFVSQSPISCPKRRSANTSSQPRSRSAPAS